MSNFAFQEGGLHTSTVLVGLSSLIALVVARWVLGTLRPRNFVRQPLIHLYLWQ